MDGYDMERKKEDEIMKPKEKLAENRYKLTERGKMKKREINHFQSKYSDSDLKFAVSVLEIRYN